MNPLTTLSRVATDRVLDRSLVPRFALPKSIAGQRVVVTGASSGIGEQVAKDVARSGGYPVLVARREAELSALATELEPIVGAGVEWFPCDLADPDAVAELGGKLGEVDVLVNNAGRSIRRSVTDTVERNHDYRRLIDLNFLGAVNLTLSVLPGMIERRHGHIINVCTWGVTAGTMPQFAGYHASKAALAAFGRSLDDELVDTGVAVTNVHFPLVRTPMISPTAKYDEAPALPVATASEWVLHAIDARPARVDPVYVAPLRVLDLLTPRVVGKLVSRVM